MENAPELIIPDFGHFRFVRALETALGSEGNWVTVKSFRSLPPSTILPLVIQQDLSTLAKERGLDEIYNFSRHPPKPERKVVTPRKLKEKEEKSGKVTESVLHGGFNPFA
jgi:hypothetical protein